MVLHDESIENILNELLAQLFKICRKIISGYFNHEGC